MLAVDSCTVMRGHIGLQHTDKMPVDYASYLLAASPPGFDVHYAFRNQFGINGGGRRNRNPFAPVKPILSTPESNDTTSGLDDVCDEISSLLVEEFQSAKSQSLPIMVCRSKTQFDLNRNENNCVKVLKKKSVSFADDLGKALVEVRLMYENSDTPPTLHPQIISSLTDGATAAVSDNPPLLLNFKQPASNYAAFREKLDKNCVCLENVILKDYKLIGTVKVKNVAFEKKVTIRATFDSWHTHLDIDGIYAVNANTTGLSSHFDTFSFELNVPPNFDPKKKMHFAVCFEASGQQFWDNNSGDNYEVLSANHQQKSKTTDNGVFDMDHDDRWTEFSNWDSVDNSVPYW